MCHRWLIPPGLDINLTDSSLSMEEQAQFMEFSKSFSGLIFDTPGLTQVACHEINTGTVIPVFSKRYRYDKLNRV